MLKKIIYQGLVAGLFIALLAGCTPAVAPAAPDETPGKTEADTDGAVSAYSLVDALSREVTFQAPPSRIVLSGKGLFMIADALYLFPGAAERIAAMGETDQGAGNFIALIDPNYTGKAVLGAQAGAEQIAAYQPDAVILKSYLAESLGSSIEALGVPVVYVEFETPTQYERDLRVIGTLLQEEARAAELVELYQARRQAVEAALSGLEESEKPRTLLLYTSDKDGKVAFNVPPLGWMQTLLVEMAGGKPLWRDASLGGGWTTVTLEQIAAWDADAIFIVSYFSDPSVTVSTLKSDPNWALLRAVREGQMYAFPFDLFSWDQPDPRWILGLQWLASRLHPQRFAEMDITAEARSFYRDFYGLDEDFFEQNILPTFKGDLP